MKVYALRSFVLCCAFTLGVGVSATSLASDILTKRVVSKNDNFIIIGGGVTGLISAKTLVEKGVNPKMIQVIERNEGAGGKVHTISYEGRSYELGAQMIISGLYSKIEEMAKKYNLTTRPLERGIHLDIESEQQMRFIRAIKSEELAQLSEQLKRYLTEYYTQWNNPALGYELLSPKGLTKIHPKLKSTWYEFIKENNYELINKALVSLLGGSGYAYRSSNPTEASLLVRVISPELIKYLIQMPVSNPGFQPLRVFDNGGYQELWKKLAKDLEQQGVGFFYSRSVTAINPEKSSTEVVTLSNITKKVKKFRATQVIYTGDIKHLSDIYSKAPRSIVEAKNNIVHSDYRSYLVKIEGLTYPATLQGKPFSFGIYPNIHGLKDSEGRIQNDALGHPVLTVKPYGDSDLMIVYVHGDSRISEEETQKNIVNDLKKAGASDVTIISGKKWNYFPRPKGDVESMMVDLMSTQGLGGIWLMGEFLSFTATFSVFDNAESFTRLLIDNQL